MVINKIYAHVPKQKHLEKRERHKMALVAIIPLHITLATIHVIFPPIALGRL
jgi:hypothetical protein